MKLAKRALSILYAFIIIESLCYGGPIIYSEIAERISLPTDIEIAAYFNRLEESIPKINLKYLFPK